MKTTLYMKGVKDEMRVWIIETLDDGIVITHGQLGGSMQNKYEDIWDGKASRTVEEQISSRYRSRINKQFDKGYKETINEALAGRTNGLGLKKQMLAQTFSNVKNIDWSTAFYQHKYDGNRCTVTKQNGNVIAYSRNGKLIKSVEHILGGMRIKEGTEIDGELYCHGVKLQTINSWIKKESEGTKNLSFRVYDAMINGPYANRLAFIQSLDLGRHANVVPTVKIGGNHGVGVNLVKSLLDESIYHGYEGGIIRWGREGYEDGKRSKHLLKLKRPDSAEFEVIDIIPSKDGWARLVLDCGVTVSAPGNMDRKYEIMDHSELYLGKIVTIDYFGLTDDKKPFQPVAIDFRDII